MTNHPITPPPELLHQWATEYWGNPSESIGEGEKYIAIQAARWGADQELEACCEWLQDGFGDIGDFPEKLHTARRPKPPSLKEQALAALGRFSSNAHTQASQMTQDFETIRRAVEQLNA